MLRELQEKLRINVAQNLYLLEAVIYILVGLLLSIAACASVIEAGLILWRGIARGTLAESGLLALDQLLLVLMLVEILHTVRISIRSQELRMVPFLIVGLIASIRRVLVITAQAAKLTQEGHNTADSAVAFHNAMIELGVLGILIVVFVCAIRLLSYPNGSALVHEGSERAGGEALEA